MERQSVDKEDSDRDPTLPPDTVTDLMGSENQKITQKKTTGGRGLGWTLRHKIKRKTLKRKKLKFIKIENFSTKKKKCYESEGWLHGVGLCFDPSIQKVAAGKSRGASGYSALFKEL